jgi:hypothetical protein
MYRSHVESTYVMLKISSGVGLISEQSGEAKRKVCLRAVGFTPAIWTSTREYCLLSVRILERSSDTLFRIRNCLLGHNLL